MVSLRDLEALGNLTDGTSAHELAETKLTSLDRELQKSKAALSKGIQKHAQIAQSLGSSRARRGARQRGALAQAAGLCAAHEAAVRRVGARPRQPRWNASKDAPSSAARSHRGTSARPVKS